MKQMKKNKKKYVILGIFSVIIVVGLVAYLFYPKPANEKAKLNLEKVSPEPVKNVREEWNELTLERMVGRISEEIQSTWNKTGVVWKGTDFSNYQVLFLQESSDGGYDEIAYLIDQEREVGKVQYKDIKKFVLKSQGSPFFKSASNKLNGIPTMTISVEPNYFVGETFKQYELTSLTNSFKYYVYCTHEEFHNTQQNWKLKKFKANHDFSEVSSMYKLKQTRFETLYHLEQAILYPKSKDESLAYAKWWWEKYRTDYLDMYKGSYWSDILEGTADYFDMAMNARTELGMNPDKNKILLKYQEMIKEDYSLETLRNSKNDILRDSYSLGAVSGMLLELYGPNNWQEQVMDDGELMQDILFYNVKSKETSATLEVSNLLTEIYQ